MKKVNCTIQGIGSENISKQVSLRIQPVNFNKQIWVSYYVSTSLPMEFPILHNNIDSILSKTSLKINDLADPTYYDGNSIDMIIGSKLFWKILCPDKLKISSPPLSLQKTDWGWLVLGETPIHALTTAHLLSIFNKTTEFNDSSTNLWCNKDCVIRSNEECETLFQKTTTRHTDGRFVVTFPFKKDPQSLGLSKNLAYRRLLSLEKKFEKEEKLKILYTEFMKEYEHLGHMTEINPNNDCTDAYYIPHLGVLNEHRLTTKLRVVYDASTKTSSGLSLNDILHAGTVIQDDLFSILLRFREYPVVICGDITKMYRQVWINPCQRSLQRILWREHPYQKIKTYQLNTVTYGTSPAAFLAIRALCETAYLHENIFPQAARSILSSFYVDDYLGGGENIEKAIKLKTEVETILATGGFSLRKWISNKKEVFKNNETINEPLYFNPKSEIAILGIQWASQEDIFKFTSLTEKFSNARHTKRSVLSESSMLFDPLGFVGPLMLRTKLLLQELWEVKITWDELISPSLNEKWITLRAEFLQLQELEIPRHVSTSSGNTITILHGFADASPKAYGVCVYIVCHTNTQTHSHLLCSKSRVAPKSKPQTLPRLELCAAKLLAELTAKILNALNTMPSNVFLWSDSEITLHWIHSPPQKWEPFVARRVTSIQNINTTIKGIWRHVPSKDNPADVISRGCNSTYLLKSTLWWHGPKWLTTGEESWPKPFLMPLPSVPDQKPVPIILSKITLHTPLIHRFSTLQKAVRVLAFCLRYITNFVHKYGKNPNYPHRNGPLSSKELEYALTTYIKAAQREHFYREIRDLTTTQEIQRSSKLINLRPFLDNDLLRVGGRLHNANLKFVVKHPLILPAEHKVTQLLMEEEHKRLLHAAPSSLLANVRQKFWPLKGKQIAKRVVNNCITCIKAKPKMLSQTMAPLPMERITPSRTFSVTGVDYAGPIHLKSSNRKNTSFIKSYVCLFVCFCTKAIHLELVSSLSTEAFLASLQRFVSRRGIPNIMYSDNAKNFVGAKNQLQKAFNKCIQDESVTNFLANKRIQWRFSPPSSPHHGGIYEAGIKSFKYHFRRIVKLRSLTFEEATTLCTQIEAVLNSRPLTPLTSDIEDLQALTPGHFLIGQPLVALPSSENQDMESNLLTRWKKINILVTNFWKKWHLDYLQNLQLLPKWYQNKIQPEIGSLALIKDRNLPPLTWKLARVISFFKNTDNVIRTVTLKTPTGVTSRAVSELCFLPNLNQ